LSSGRSRSPTAERVHRRERERADKIHSLVRATIIPAIAEATTVPASTTCSNELAAYAGE
jgi:hypothetical protein